MVGVTVRLLAVEPGQAKAQRWCLRPVDDDGPARHTLRRRQWAGEACSPMCQLAARTRACAACQDTVDANEPARHTLRRRQWADEASRLTRRQLPTAAPTRLRRAGCRLGAAARHATPAATQPNRAQGAREARRGDGAAPGASRVAAAAAPMTWSRGLAPAGPVQRFSDNSPAVRDTNPARRPLPSPPGGSATGAPAASPAPRQQLAPFAPPTRPALPARYRGPPWLPPGSPPPRGRVRRRRARPVASPPLGLPRAPLASPSRPRPLDSYVLARARRASTPGGAVALALGARARAQSRDMGGPENTRL